LENIRALFSELYRDQIKKTPTTTRIECPFDPYFDRQIAELENKDAALAPPIVKISQVKRADDGNDSETAANAGSEYSPTDGEFPSSVKDDSLAPTPDTSRPASPAAHLLAAKNNGRPRGSRRQRKAVNAAAVAAFSGTGIPQSSGEESGSQPGKQAKKKGKRMRRWGADGTFEDVDDDAAQLDFSSKDADRPENAAALEDVDQSSWGTRTADGAFMLKDIGDEMDAIISASNEKKNEQKPGGVVGSSLGALSGLFRNVVGGKVLTKDDLDKPLKTMEDHLMKKNVAREAAVRLCDSIERDLVGVKTSNFTSMFYGFPDQYTNIRRHRSNHPYSNGNRPPQNAHPNHTPRPAPRNNLDHKVIHQPSTIRHLHCRCQWRRKINQPEQNMLFSPTKRAQSVNRGRRHIPIRSRRTTTRPRT
jgi:signal recognition particle receptor subunit alpha